MPLLVITQAGRVFEWPLDRPADARLPGGSAVAKPWGGDRAIVGHAEGVTLLSAQSSDSSEISGWQPGWSRPTAEPVIDLWTAEAYVVALTAARAVVLDEAGERRAERTFDGEALLAVVGMDRFIGRPDSLLIGARSGRLRLLDVDLHTELDPIGDMPEESFVDFGAHPDGPLVGITATGAWFVAADGRRWRVASDAPLLALQETVHFLYALGETGVVQVEPDALLDTGAPASGARCFAAFQRVESEAFIGYANRICQWDGETEECGTTIGSDEVVALCDVPNPDRFAMSAYCDAPELVSWQERPRDPSKLASNPEGRTGVELFELLLAQHDEREAPRRIREQLACDSPGLWYFRTYGAIQWLRHWSVEQPERADLWLQHPSARALWQAGRATYVFSDKSDPARIPGEVLALARSVAALPDGSTILESLQSFLNDPWLAHGGHGPILPAQLELERLDEIDWSDLRHCYGEASDTPKHLKALASPNPKRRESALSALSGSIYHQGSTYEATRAAVPFMIGLLGNLDPEGQSEILAFLFDIAAAESWHARHADSIFFKDDKDTPLFQSRIAEERDHVGGARAAVQRGWPVYRTLLSSPVAEIRALACRALSVARPSAARVDADLAERIDRDPTPGVRGSALDARFGLTLGERGVDAAIAFVREYLDDRDPFVRWTAARLDLEFKGKRALPDSLAVIVASLNPSEALLASAKLAQDTRPRSGIAATSIWIVLALGVGRDHLDAILDALDQVSDYATEALAGDVVFGLFPSEADDAPVSSTDRRILSRVFGRVGRMHSSFRHYAVHGVLGRFVPHDVQLEARSLSPLQRAFIEALIESEIPITHIFKLSDAGLPLDKEALRDWLDARP